MSENGPMLLSICSGLVDGPILDVAVITEGLEVIYSGLGANFLAHFHLGTPLF